MQLLKKIFSFLIIALLPLWSVAQCSVCSAAVSSSLSNGGGVAKGINHAILYLMAFPYLIFLGFMAYRHREFLGYQIRTLVQRWRMS